MIEDQEADVIKTYTVFCQALDGTPTIWIDFVTAYTVEGAIKAGREACHKAWGGDDEDIEGIHVLGVALGNVNILFWKDLEG